MTKTKTKPGLAVKNSYGLLTSIPKEYAKRKIQSVVEIPAGECPISLKGMLTLGDFPSHPEIIEWYHQIRDYGLENGIFYTGVAIAFWARGDYDCFGYEYEAIHDFIMNYATMRGEYADQPTPKRVSVLD
jgi:hypothetical protein